MIISRAGKTQISILRGDITEQETDAIVNAANSSLMGGGGVDGAIHRKGGPRILDECEKIRASAWKNGLPAGRSVITTGGKLKAKHIIHTVGPVWKGGNQSESQLLTDAYLNSLRLSDEYRLKTIAFPSISTGAYGYPIEIASITALASVKDYLENEGKDSSLAEVRFVLFGEYDLKVYERRAMEVFGRNISQVR